MKNYNTIFPNDISLVPESSVNQLIPSHIVQTYVSILPASCRPWERSAVQAAAVALTGDDAGDNEADGHRKETNAMENGRCYRDGIHRI